MINLRYQLVFTNRAKKDIERLPALMSSRIVRALEHIAKDPFCGKALKGELRDLYSYRVGDYRLIYRIEKNKILVIVLKVGHRSNVYK